MGHKQHGAKKFEQYYGVPYKSKTFRTVYECPRCGWRRPDESTVSKCPTCGVALYSRVIKVERVQSP